MPRTSMIAAIVLIAGICASSSTALLAPSPSRAAPTPQTYLAIADTFVDAGAPRQQFGASAELHADASPDVQRILLRFSLAGAPAGAVPASARLRLFTVNESPDAAEVLTVDGEWTEAETDWGNAPATGTRIADMPPAAEEGRWIEADVTSAVVSGGEVDFYIVTEGEDRVGFRSREGGSEAPALVVEWPEQATSIAVEASDDASIWERQPDENRGTADLEADGEPRSDFLLKFTVTGVGAAVVTDARIRLVSVGQSGTGGDIYATGETGWDESTVTWNTAPPVEGARLDSLGDVSEGSAYEFDVGAVVDGDGTYSFRVVGPSRDGADYSSREDADPPQLVLQLATPSSAPTPTAPPSASSTPPSAPGDAMPMGDLPGWRQVLAEDFNTATPTGEFPGDAYPLWALASPDGVQKGTYLDGWKDTSRNGTYSPSKVLSVHDGMLDFYLHTESGRHLVAAPVPQVFQTYGRYSVRFRADPVPGYKTSWLLWPMSEVWPDEGEINYPEGKLTSTIHAYMHYASPEGGQDAFDTDAGFEQWHIATIEWTPGKVVFFLDGVAFATSTTDVPSTAMKWVLQTETQTSGGPPRDSAEGHVYVDWVVAYALAGGPGPSPTPTPTPVPTAAPTAQPTATPTAPPPPSVTGTPSSGDLSIAAVGDIHPPSESANSAATALEAAKADLILGLGDYQYQDGTMAEYNAYFDRDWGPNVPKMYPVLAPTHDQDWFGVETLAYWNGGGASGYKAPVTLLPHTSYSFDRAGWHFVAIDDACYRDLAHCSPDALLTWLRADLAAHPAQCTIAYWHQPYFTSTADHAAFDAIKPVVEVLYAAGVDVVLQAHNHNYERFDPQDADRVADPNGIRAFVVGTGGIGFYDFRDTAPNSAARADSTFGVLRMTLHDGSYDWEFVRTGGTDYSDSGSGVCH